MLPGFRFLFAATLLTVSFLIFGLGAAALLRASHERFAAMPARFAPAPVPTPFVDAALPSLPALPALAVLRVAPAVVDVPTAAEPVPASPADTLLPTDRTAAPVAVMGGEDNAAPAAFVPTADVEAEIEAKSEPRLEPTVAPPAEVAAVEPQTGPTLFAPPVLTAVQVDPLPRGDPLVVAVPAPAVPQQVLPEAAVTETTAVPIIVEPPLLNAEPIRRPPLPANRPATANVASLSDPSVGSSDAAARKSAVRLRKPIAGRASKPKRRVVTRRQPPRPLGQAPASPFGAPGFGASPFGT